MLKLKLQPFGHLMQIDNSLEKSLMLGKIKGRKRRGCKRIRRPDRITDAMNMNLGKVQEMVRGRVGWHVAVYGVAKSQTGQLSLTDAMNMNLGKLREMVRGREGWHIAVYGVAKSQTGQLNSNNSFPPLCLRSVLCVCVSTPALQIFLHQYRFS